METGDLRAISANRASPCGVASLLAAGLLLNAAGAGATPGASGPQVVAGVPAGFSRPLPTDGALGFSYTRAPDVVGCSQKTEAEVRDLLVGVVHTDPFVPAGKQPTFTLKVEMTRPAPDLYRATFSLFDERGTPRGVSKVEDRHCDDAHLKLVGSIALLLQPRPPGPDGPCDEACRAGIEAKAKERAAAELREKEVPKLKEAAKAAARAELEARRRQQFRAVVGAGAVVAGNLASDAAPGFWLSAEARRTWWSIGLEMRALLPARAFDLAGGGALAQATATGLVVPCLQWRWLGGCALVEAGGVFVSGAGVTGGGALTGALLGLGVRARIELPVAAGFDARVFGDLMGYPLALQAQGAGGAGGAAFTFDAPRRVAGFVGFGLGRAFE